MKKTLIIGGGNIPDYIEKVTQYKKYSQADFPDYCKCRKGHICHICNQILKGKKNYHRVKNRIREEIEQQIKE